ncbi:MAG: hypothetical protein LBR83_03645 [Clostridiales bacterium]|jgi:hypothetical protein|nr:hypothetical protein [Clostridiales bacterium]
MYNLIRKSIKNFAGSFEYDEQDIRYVAADFLLLLTDADEYQRQKAADTAMYRRLSHFLWQISGCERCEQLLYELNALGFSGERQCMEADFTEPHKLLHMMYLYAYS